MRYFKIKCSKCGSIQRLVFEESQSPFEKRSSHIELDREIKILIINGEKWVDGPIPALEDFCFGDCHPPDSDLNLIGQVQKYLIQQLQV